MIGRLARLQNLPALRVCGLMSGTSLDGIDAAILTISGSGNDTHVAIEAFHTFPYDISVREELLAIQRSPDLAIITRVNMALGNHFARAVTQLCERSGISLASIDLIGSHGQTVHHAPERLPVLGIISHGTLQLGDPSVIAQETGIVTIGDFRVADCAAGGEGAPLIPAVDHILFRSTERNRVLLNIGGISNITLLPRGGSRNDVWGFDTGPGNMIIDALCAQYYGESYDRDGVHAASGKVSETRLSILKNNDYFSRRPPKSTGREQFNSDFIAQCLKLANDISPDDLIATATEFTAVTIAKACRVFVHPVMRIDEVIVSGGGAHNLQIMRRLCELLSPTLVHTTEDFGIPVDAKEAIGFAILANETIHENTGNIPAATGAHRAVVLGKICL